MTGSARRRCAIYTRKSSEEGLEQGFNSLDAQREACAAYVRSQIGEGWELQDGIYDDGGFSGGSMERPALQRLLTDIDRGRIDIVVVYKVDRLTRSLADFARIVERFEARNASFVSITQSFNTTTSMGRLTLNVLLSFAQFEREVTGERIRDKIAASKAKGLWMGGRPMLGYKPTGRTLEIDPEEADTVRYIFRRYLDLGSVHALQADLKQSGIHGKRWTTRKDVVAGGETLARGALYHPLRNRHYLGEIVHKEITHPGQHAAIIDAELFAAVQASLDANAQARDNLPLRPGGSPLTGLIFDDAGHPMSPTHGRGRSRTPHRYYVSKARLIGQSERAGTLARIPAYAIEDLVADRIGRLIEPDAFDWAHARTLIGRIVVRADAVDILFANGVSADAAERVPTGDALSIDPETGAHLCVPIRLGRRGGSVRLLDPHGRRIVDRADPDPALLNALARGWRWRTALANGSYKTVTALAAAEGLSFASVTRLLRLAYLAPDLIEDILDGRQRPGVTIDELCRPDLPLDWAAQRRLFGARSAA